MKRLLALFFSFCIILSSTISVEAKSLDDYSSTYIEYISDDLYAEVTLSVAPQNNNSSFSINDSLKFKSATRVSSKQKSASKTYTIRNKYGKELAKYTLTGAFTYNGSSSTCTRATCSTSIINPTYSFTQKSAWCSGDTAVGSFTLSSSRQTTSKTLTLTCSANGNIQ